MIRIRTNLGTVVDSISNKLSQLQYRDKLLRAVATNVLAEMKLRIHTEGQDATGAQIGEYSESYMKVRTGDFQNAPTVTRGARKGKRRNAGVFTESVIRLNKENGVFTGEDKVGKARPKYNRTADKKVICSLTRNMENDIKILATPAGYGIGYSNEVNAQKVDWLEATYNKKIFFIGERERKIIVSTIENYNRGALQ